MLPRLQFPVLLVSCYSLNDFSTATAVYVYFIGNVQSVDMYSAQYYDQLRYCAQRGVYEGIMELGCDTNDCLCRTDILVSVITAISVSAYSYCYDNNFDATSAMGMLISYCTSNGYSAPSSLATISVPSPAGESLTLLPAAHY